MEIFGISLYDDSPGVFEKGGHAFGRPVLGRILLYSPFLTAADLFRHAVDPKSSSWLWSVTVVVLLAAMIYLVDRWLIGMARRWKEDGGIGAAIAFTFIVLAD